MPAGRYSFDVETRVGSRWVIDCIETQEQAARARASALLADAKCAGARIIRTWTRPDGVGVDTEIFCQTREIEDDSTVRIAWVDGGVGVCRSIEAYFGFESRQAMSRIFHAYLAEVVLTPTEILHDARQLKRILLQHTLVREAVDMVARLQAEDGEDFAVRRSEIHKAIDAILELARGIEAAALPKLAGGFGAAMAVLGAQVARERRDYLMLAALSAVLGAQRGWLGKLEVLCGMAEAESAGDALDLLDGVIADVLATEVIDDLLGMQPNLGATIRALFDLADGIEPAPSDGGAVTAGLCRLLAAGRLPASRRCIGARAHRALRLKRPLKPNDPAQEAAELGRIIGLVATIGGLHSGAETALALTLRAARLVEQGGKPGRRAAIRAVFMAMPDMARGVRYLCDAARSDLGSEHLADMEALFDLVLEAEGFGAFCDRGLDARERMACATGAFHAMAGSAFSERIVAGVCGHIDTLLEEFVIGERIIEKLDQPDGHLRERALLLVRFCGSGLLPEGKALTKARGRVLALLRQPDFLARFVAGIDDAGAAQAAIRDFFGLLKSSGVSEG